MSDWPGRLPDGTFHPVYLVQIKNEWHVAQANLATATRAVREAHRVWDEAVQHEVKMALWMYRILREAGEPMPEVRGK